MLFSLIFSLFFFSSCDKDNVDEADNNLNEQKDSDESEDIVVDVSSTPLKFRITSELTVEVRGDSNDYENKSIIIPTKIKIGEKVYNVTGIGDDAFNPHSGGISSIEIPKSVTYIGSNFARMTCESEFTSINVSPDNPNFTSVDGVLYDKSKKKLMTVPNGKTGVFVVPDGVTSIGEDAFSYCCGITGVKIPSSVKSIGSFAFGYCWNLESIEISYGITSIEPNTFYCCGALRNVKIPSSVTEIGSYAFYNCYSLTSIEIPSSVTEIGSYAFSGCDNLDIVIDNSEENLKFYSYEYDWKLDMHIEKETTMEDFFADVKSVTFIK